MLNVTTVGALLGIGIFMLGIHGFRYMQARLLGRWNRVRIMHGWLGQYRTMIREGNAPLWPLALYLVCCPLGIIVIFAFIFSGKPAP
jgi:hypothetical protein